jgi:hypothetical protein
LVGRVAFGQILPGRSGAQYPEDSVEDVAWISPGSSSSVFSSRWIWDEWLQYVPLLVCEVHAALVLLLEGYMTAPLYPHFRIYEIASREFQENVLIFQAPCTGMPRLCRAGPLGYDTPMHEKPGEDFYSVEKAAKLLGRTPERIRQMLRAGVTVMMLMTVVCRHFLCSDFPP